MLPEQQFHPTFRLTSTYKEEHFPCRTTRERPEMTLPMK